MKSFLVNMFPFEMLFMKLKHTCANNNNKTKNYRSQIYSMMMMMIAETCSLIRTQCVCGTEKKAFMATHSLSIHHCWWHFRRANCFAWWKHTDCWVEPNSSLFCFGIGVFTEMHMRDGLMSNVYSFDFIKSKFLSIFNSLSWLPVWFDSIRFDLISFFSPLHCLFIMGNSFHLIIQFAICERVRSLKQTLK